MTPEVTKIVLNKIIPNVWNETEQSFNMILGIELAFRSNSYVYLLYITIFKYRAFPHMKNQSILGFNIALFYISNRCILYNMSLFIERGTYYSICPCFLWKEVHILTIYITVFVTRGRHFGARESV